MSNTNPASSEHGALASIRDRVTAEWNHLKTIVRTKFDRLTDEDVHAVDGRYDELSQRLSRTYGYDQERADDEISRFVSEGGNSAPYTAAAEEARAGDHRGIGAEVGRDDRPVPQTAERLPPDRSR